MPMIDAGDGCLLNVSIEGRDSGPTLMLSNSLGCTLEMWEPQMAALTKEFRVIRYDRRGHGKSSVPPGPYSRLRTSARTCRTAVSSSDFLAACRSWIARRCTKATPQFRVRAATEALDVTRPSRRSSFAGFPAHARGVDDGQRDPADQ